MAEPIDFVVTAALNELSPKERPDPLHEYTRGEYLEAMCILRDAGCDLDAESIGAYLTEQRSWTPAQAGAVTQIVREVNSKQPKTPGGHWGPDTLQRWQASAESLKEGRTP
jgi:hypothetical protein